MTPAAVDSPGRERRLSEDMVSRLPLRLVPLQG